MCIYGLVLSFADSTIAISVNINGFGKLPISVLKSFSTSINKFINRLDKNGDKKVSLWEFKRGEKQFNHLDKNNDGYITIEEAPTGPPSKNGNKMPRK